MKPKQLTCFSNDKINSMIPTCVVLDTNFCLDLFVFHDPRYTDFSNALKNKSIHAITRADCREEWLRVLNYPKLALNEQSRYQSMQEYDQLITCINSNDLASNDYSQLPICSDKDDQKFLECAYTEKAKFLITKDKALIKLARKTAKAGLFHIIQPGEWLTISQTYIQYRHI